MCPYRKQITFRSLHILLTRHLSALKRTVSFFSLFSSGTLSRNESQESDFELFDFRPALGENVGYFAKKEKYHISFTPTFLRARRWLNRAEHKTKPKPSLIWNAVSGRSVLRCTRQRSTAITWQTPTTHSSWEPEQHLRMGWLAHHTIFLQVWLLFSSLCFHLSSHHALKFQALLFCSQCCLLCAALPPVGHSFLYMRARTFLLEHRLFSY